MKSKYLKNQMHLVLNHFLFFILFLGLVNLSPTSVQAETADQADSSQPLEILQGSPIHHFVAGSDTLTFSLDVKEPQAGVTYHWDILSPARHGVAQAAPIGTRAEVTYKPEDGYAGEDHFSVRVSSSKGETATAEILVTVEPQQFLPEMSDPEMPKSTDHEMPDRRELERIDNKPSVGMRKPGQDNLRELQQAEIEDLREEEQSVRFEEIEGYADVEGTREGPYIQVLMYWNQIGLHDGWTPYTTANLNIDDPDYGGENDYVDSTTVDDMGSAYFNIDGFILEPGQIITVSDGTVSKSHTIVNLAVIGFDDTADTLSGKANPGELGVWACDDFTCDWVYPIADSSGEWTADFSSLVDIAPGSAGDAFQYDADGDETRIRWSLPDPNIRVFPLDNFIGGYDWTPDTLVSLTIDSTLINSEYSNDLGRVFFSESFTLVPGNEIVLSDGTFTRTHTITNLSVTEIDEDTETISGTANPGDLTLEVNDGMLYTFYPVADEFGSWRFDLAGSLDLRPGISGYARQFDAENNSTNIYWYIANPKIEVSPTDDYVFGFNWVADTAITLKIDGLEIETLTSDTSGDVYFYPEYDILPGQIVELTDGTYTRTHTVTNLTITNIDEDTETISGTAEPRSEVRVEGSNDSEWDLIAVFTDGDGDWTATFENLDIAPGTHGYATQYDPQGNSTNIDWFIASPLNPFFEVYPIGDYIYGHNWTPNTPVTLTINSVVIGTEDSSEWGFVYFYPPDEISAGQEIILSDGTYTRTHIVTNLAVTGINETLNTISGTAAAESEVYVYGDNGEDWDEDTILADGSGNWTATFTYLDITPGTSGYAIQYDSEGNSTNIRWYVPHPYMEVHPDRDYAYGYDWTPNTSITLTINDEVIESSTSNEQGSVYFYPEYDISATQIVEMTDGTYTRAHTVTGLTVTDIDEDANSISGIAAPETDIYVIGGLDNDWQDFTVTADSSGNWTALFTTIDIFPGVRGEASQFDEQGNSTNVHWFMPAPYIEVYPRWNEIQGESWGPSTSISLTIDSVYIGTEISDQYGSVYFYPANAIESGQFIEMTDGISTISYTVSNHTVTGVNADTNTVSGTADPGSTVDVTHCNETDCYNQITVADPSGNWHATFTSPELKTGDHGYASQSDGKNATYIYWNIPDPYFDVYPLSDYLIGNDWSPNTIITASIGGTTIGSGMSDEDGWVYIYSSSFDIQSGQEIIVTDGTFTKSHMVKNIVVTEINPSTEIVSGSADPLSELTVSAYAGAKWYYRYPVTNSSGQWSVDFSSSADLTTDTYGWAYQDDLEGNSTCIRWFVPDPYIYIYPQDDYISGQDWPPNTTVTLTIGSQTWSGVTDESFGAVSFYLQPFDVQTGQTVTLSGGGYTKIHIVRNLSVTSIDEVNDILAGTAKANNELSVRACNNSCQTLTAMANASGIWNANFYGLVDIIAGSSGWISQYDDDGDYTRITWELVNPYFEVHPNSDRVNGYDWTPETPVTLHIDGVLKATVESSASGYVYFSLDSFDIQPGQEVVLSDGTFTKTHRVISLSVSTVDEENNILNGTANPGPLTVYASDDITSEVISPVADGNGDWSVNLTSVDITEGTSAYIWQEDDNGDSTSIWWLIPDPTILAYPQFDSVGGDGWPQLTDVTLTIDTTRETWVETSDETGYVRFDLGDFDLLPEHELMMSESSGTYNEVYTVKEIKVTQIDLAGDTISGTAEPLLALDISAYVYNGMYTQLYNLTTTVDADGIWQVDFTSTADITADTYGYVNHYDEYDNVTQIYWEPCVESPIITGQDPLSTPEETSLEITLDNLIVTDGDSTYPDDFTLSVLDGTNYSRSGNTITPAVDFNGTLTVPVKVNDGANDSNTFNLSVSVTPVNDPPVITGQTALSTTEDTPLLITLTNLTVTDPDDSYPADFDLSVLSGIDYTLLGDTITPAQDYSGTLTVPVKVNDGAADSNIYDLTVTVTPVNDPPVVGDIPDQDILEGETFSTITLDDYVTDVDHAVNTMVWTHAGSSSLTVSIVDRVASITIPAGWSGSETITFTATDPGGAYDSDDATFSVNAAANNPPVITESDPQSVTMSEDSDPTPFSLTLTASDADEDPLTWSISTLAAHGTASIIGSGTSISVNYTPTLNYSGSDNFIVKVSDGNGGTDTIKVNVTIQPVNDAPVIISQNGTLTTPEETALLIELSHLVVTDVDNTYPTGFSLTVLPGTNYTLSGNTITPVAGFTGILTVRVKVNDGGLDSNTFNLTVTVTEKVDEGSTVFLPLIFR